LRILFSFFAAAVLGYGTPVGACQVPVFRYALERWRPQAYEVVVFHRGPLARTLSAVVKSIDELSPPANLLARDVDLDGVVDEDTQRLWKAQRAEQLPWIVVQAPGADHELHAFWSGPLDSADFKPLVDSPVRRAIGRHLAAGESAVWVLVEGGNKDRDDAAFQLLEAELKKLERRIALPIPDPGMIATDLPLKVSFPLLRVSRSDFAENLFLRLLFFRDKTLADSTEPIAVPIFGRGRALICLSGNDINAGQVAQVGNFLAGQCSCEVKEQNPGWDLLMAEDWDSVLREHAVPQSPTLSPFSTLSTPSTSSGQASSERAPAPPPFVAGASLPAAPSAAAPIPPPGVISQRRPVLIAAAGMAAVLTVVFGWLTFRPKSQSRRRQ
jgi:hypothetical protein